MAGELRAGTPWRLRPAAYGNAIRRSGRHRATDRRSGLGTGIVKHVGEIPSSGRNFKALSRTMPHVVCSSCVVSCPTPPNPALHPSPAIPNASRPHQVRLE